MECFPFLLANPVLFRFAGSVLLLASDRNEPLGLRNVHARTSHSSIPAGFPVGTPRSPGGTQLSPAPQPDVEKPVEETGGKKKTGDGKIILDPQPEDSVNDPLNWPSWRRDCALLSLGFYCMIGGGMTPLIAAGFTNVAQDFDVSVERVSLTTGLYMMGLGLGSVIASPTAILFGKRPVYLAGAILFIGTSVWAGYSPSFSSLIAARVFQGVAVSPVECLPSATIAEIFFLHERAYRIGIYTLLLLGGKNIVPLVSAAIIGRFGWRWAFLYVASVPSPTLSLSKACLQNQILFLVQGRSSNLVLLSSQYCCHGCGICVCPTVPFRSRDLLGQNTNAASLETAQLPSPAVIPPCRPGLHVCRPTVPPRKIAGELAVSGSDRASQRRTC